MRASFVLIPAGGIAAFATQDYAVIYHAATSGRIRFDFMGLFVAEMESVTAHSAHLPLTVPGSVSDNIRECHELLLSACRLGRDDSDYRSIFCSLYAAPFADVYKYLVWKTPIFKLPPDWPTSFGKVPTLLSGHGKDPLSPARSHRIDIGKRAP
jgi:hypothetical protein